MMNKQFLTITGIILAAILFLSVNIISAIQLTGMRLDLTENRLFTLSDGTLNVLGDLTEPVTLKLYYSESLSKDAPEIRTHATRVQNMLNEYVNLAGGKVRLEIIDPEPFSENEDRATSDGLQGVPLGQSGTVFYFGLVGENMTDDREVIEFLQPSRAKFLEYDLTRMVYALSSPSKPKVAIVSSFPLEFGPGGIQAAMQGRSQPYAIMEALEEFFDVQVMRNSFTTIPDDTDALVVLHAKTLDEVQLYAIDQFIVKGGKAMVFADPFSETGAALPPPPGQPPNPLDTHSSRLPQLLAKWGVRIPDGKIVIDREIATRVNIGRGRRQLIDYVAWLNTRDGNHNTDDIATSDIERLQLGSVGHIERAEGSAVTVTPLVTSSTQSMEIDAAKIRFRPDPEGLIAAFEASGRQFVLAARLNGVVDSAFAQAPKEAENPADFVSKGEKAANIILVADADMLADQFWAQRVQALGQSIIQPTSSNAIFLINGLENLAGSSDLVSLRSRGAGDRPFVVVEELRRTAEQKFLAKEKELTQSLEETERKLADLQSKAGESGGQLLSEEETAAIDSFQEQAIDIRKQLRAVQHGLRRDIDDLETRLKVLNIAAVPAAVFVIAIVLALLRRRRRIASQRTKEA